MDSKREKVYRALTLNAYSFTELFEELNRDRKVGEPQTGLSRVSLSDHLKNLENEGKIERIFKNGKVVYQIKLDVEKIFAELKPEISIGLIQYLESIWPDLSEELLRILKVLAERIEGEEKKRRGV